MKNLLVAVLCVVLLAGCETTTSKVAVLPPKLKAVTQPTLLAKPIPVDPLDAVIDDQPFGTDYPRLRDYKVDADPPHVRVSMSNQELADYFRRSVLGELQKALDDPKENSFVKSRLQWLLAQMNAGTIKLDMSFGPPPGHERAFAISWVGGGQRYITYVGSSVYAAEVNLKPQAFHDLVVSAAVHETLHPTAFLSQASATREEEIQDESAVWVTMIQKVIRPWYKQGRHPGSSQWKVAKYFSKCGDNPKSASWMKIMGRLTGED